MFLARGEDAILVSPQFCKDFAIIVCGRNEYWVYLSRSGFRLGTPVMVGLVPTKPDHDTVQLSSSFSGYPHLNRYRLVFIAPIINLGEILAELRRD